ncbi:MAG TPA: TAXI family TRAP transporter solute-binding subunit [Alphaproteobacteria bacterium]|nr:TAXI family TRAP transporter solute-binding subunit [Alphaproteobacteria bacterium]
MRILTAFAAIVLGACVLADPTRAQPDGIGTSPQGTLTYTLGSAYAKALQTTAGIQARVQPSTGTGVMVPLVETGELDIGFVNTLELTDAYTGTGSFAGRKLQNLRVVGVLFPIRSGFFVKKDSPIKEAKDLKGKTIPYGYTSQEVLRTVVDGLLANAGLTANDVRTVLVPNLIRGVDDFISGRTDASYFAVGQAKVAEADASVGGIRFLPIYDTPEAVAAMQKVVPTSFVDTVNPAPNSPGITGPTKMMFYDYVMFVNANLPKDRVYAFTKVLAEQKDAMAETMPLFKDMKVARMHRDIRIPYHEGAEAYYKDKNIALTK